MKQVSRIGMSSWNMKWAKSVNLTKHSLNFRRYGLWSGYDFKRFELPAKRDSCIYIKPIGEQ